MGEMGTKWSDFRDEREATAVFVADDSALDGTGDEYRVWDVYLGDDDGEVVKWVEQGCRSRNAAMDKAELVGFARGLEVVES